MNEVYKEKAKELLNEFMKFAEGDERRYLRDC